MSKKPHRESAELTSPLVTLFLSAALGGENHPPPNGDGLSQPTHRDRKLPGEER